jgi:hypothetical protein
MDLRIHKLLAYTIFIAILPLPYIFYILLRPLVFLIVIYLLFRDWKNINRNTKVILIVITILFNPIAAIYLSKFLWIPIDFVCGYYFLKHYPGERE